MRRVFAKLCLGLAGYLDDLAVWVGRSDLYPGEQSNAEIDRIRAIREMER